MDLGLELLFFFASDEVEEEEGGLFYISAQDVALVAIVPICLLATLMGAATKSEKWVEVPPQRLNLSIAPTLDKGFRAALTVNF